MVEIIGTRYKVKQLEILILFFFLDNNVGYAVGGGGVGGGVVLKTTNGGLLWETKFSGTSWPFYSVHFVDYNIGWVAGDYNRIYKTTNGGNSWITQYTTASHSLWSIFFVNSNTGWVIGGSNDFAQIIMKTTDGGGSWISQAGINLKQLLEIFFVDEYTGWAVGIDGTILFTNNGGITFIEKNYLEQKIRDFGLLQNYPNPFNPSTTIKFALPERAKVNLSVYNLLGEKVAELVDGELEAGYHETKWNASGFASSIYFYNLRANDFVETKKLVLMK